MNYNKLMVFTKYNGLLFTKRLFALSEYVVLLYVSFGMYHDTDKIGCKGRDGKRLHIMAPTFEADTVAISWSTCSRRDVTNFLE